MKYDLIIIGAGPAGLTASLYAARYKVKVLVLGQVAGGTAITAFEVHNYPAIEKIKGVELMKNMVNQVKKLDVEIKNEEVREISKREGFEIKTNKEVYSAKKIIIATGEEKRKLGIEREKELCGKGISYCATCDATFYKDKVVAVYGGGNSALSSALLLSKYAKEVYIIYRRDKFFRADAKWVEEVEENKKITCLFNSRITKLIGESKLEEIELNNKDRLKIDGLFIEIGGIPNLSLSEDLGIKTERGEIIVDKFQKTNVKGVFAAGDVTNNPLKQIITACGEGAVAAYSAHEELRE